MSGTTRPGAVALLVLAAAAVARSGDLPEAEAPRRAAIAKLGRMVFADLGKPVAFCDLDGGNVLRTEVGPVTSLKWLRDGKRVLATANGRVLTIDAESGKATDLTPDRPDDVFVASYPVLSPDGRYGVYWHSPRRDHLPLDPFAYAVFDFEAGGFTDVGSLAFEDVRRPSHFERPFAWWSPDGRLHACVAGDAKPDEKRGSRWKLVRWSPIDGTTETEAELPWGTRVTQMAFLGDRVAYVIDGQQQHHYVPRVVSGKGDVLFELPQYGLIWGIRFEEDGAALRLRIQAPDATHTTKFWRAEPGKPTTEIAEFEPPTGVRVDGGAARVEERRDGDATSLVRVDAKTGETRPIGPGNSPVRVGDVVVFWRVTIPSKQAEGPYFEHPRTIPGTDDLWAFDPKDGAVIRLTDRGFQATCWNIRANDAGPAKR